MLTFAAIVLCGSAYSRCAGLYPVAAGQVIPKPPVVAQPTTTNVVLPAPTNLPAATTAAVPAATGPDRTLRSRSDVMNSQLNAPSRIPTDLKMLAGKEPPPLRVLGLAWKAWAAARGAAFSVSGMGPT